MNFHVEDEFDAVPNTYQVMFKYLENLSPTFTVITADQSFMIPTTRTMNMASVYDDPENLSYTTTITINGTDISSYSAFASYDYTTHVLDFFPTDNTHGGLHALAITVDDGISVPVTTTFNVDI